MNFSRLVQEIYDTNVNKSYNAANSPARKDFAPVNSKNGYNYSYQNNGASEMDNPLPDNPITHPWELQTVSDDLSDAFVSIVSGCQKIMNSIDNPALNLNQKNDLKKLFRYSKKILRRIKNVAVKVDDIADITVPRPPEVKMNASMKTNPTRTNNSEIAIQLPSKK
jgi:hypothetical protein